jgi:hypothetical protein
MKNLLIFSLLLLNLNLLFGQKLSELKVSTNYNNINFQQKLNYSIKLQKGEIYNFLVMQKGVDIELFLYGSKKNLVLQKDTPNGANGLEKFEYLAPITGIFYLEIRRLDGVTKNITGQVDISVNKLIGKEKKYRKRIIKELELENKKTVQTLDVDHFWEAFDYLENCKSKQDSIDAFQKLYIDRATNGLLDFIAYTNMTAEEIVETVAVVPKFYKSIRENTNEIKNMEPAIEEIVERFKKIYPKFEPHKINFSIGILNTGGTVSEDFLLIGSELVAATNKTDLSEIPSEAFKKQLASSTDVEQRVKNFIAHEYVHTQQPPAIYAEDAICQLLYRAMREGFCDFIGELLSGSPINIVVLEYGDKHEEELWQEFKNELCNTNSDNWFYNYSNVEEKPGDLGYYIGYKIAEAYYRNSDDKKQAIVDIIEMDDPISLLQKSGYDRQKKNKLDK